MSSSHPITNVTLVHLTILVKKVDSMSYEEFHDYWSNSHPKIWLSVSIVKRNLVKYMQYHVDHVTSAALREHGLPVSDYDGGVEMWGRSVEEIMAIFQDEEYQRVVIPDEMKFIEREECKFMIGHDEVKFVEGKVIEA